MIILGDIGNSEVKICLYKKNKLIKKIILKSSLINNSYIKRKLSIFNKNTIIDQILFSSVVPKIYLSLKRFFKKNFKINCIEVKQLKLEKLIKIAVNKRQIGSDRLCNAIAVKNNKDNFIVVDFGTATTFDVIVRNKYLGGIIAPGISLSLNSLISRASLIPYIELQKTTNIIAKNTVNAVRSGFYWGYLGLVQNIIKKISIETKKKYKIVLTGGYCHLFRKSIKNKSAIDKEITIRGLLKISNLI